MKIISLFYLLGLVGSLSLLKAAPEAQSQTPTPVMQKDDLGNSVTLVNSIDPLVDITFTGGPVGNLLDLCRDSLKGSDVNIIVTRDARKVEIQPFEITNATINQLLWLLSELGTDKLDYSSHNETGQTFLFKLGDQSKEQKLLIDQLKGAEKRLKEKQKAHTVSERKIIAISIADFLKKDFVAEPVELNSQKNRNVNFEKLLIYKEERQDAIKEAIKVGCSVARIDIPSIHFEQGTETIFVAGTPKQVQVAKALLEGILDK